MSSPLEKVELQATSVACTRALARWETRLSPIPRSFRLAVTAKFQLIYPFPPCLLANPCWIVTVRLQDLRLHLVLLNIAHEVSLIRHHSQPQAFCLFLDGDQPNRQIWENPTDPQPTTSFGDSVIQKSPHSIRLFFQNVHGLCYSTGLEDYRYYLQSNKTYHIDIMGLAETNVSWHHLYLQFEFEQIWRRILTICKVEFGSPTQVDDNALSNSSYQAGGLIQLSLGPLTSAIFGKSIIDPSGLGRWRGVIFRGSDQFSLSVITAYRMTWGYVESLMTMIRQSWSGTRRLTIRMWNSNY
jgi:hypothetical protein